MLIYIAICVIITLNLLLWGVAIYDQRRLYKLHKREMEIKMQRVVKLFTNVITRIEVLENDKREKGKVG